MAKLQSKQLVLYSTAAEVNPLHYADLVLDIKTN